MPTSIATIQINASTVEISRVLSNPQLVSEWLGGLRPGRLVGGEEETKLEVRSPDSQASATTRLDPESELMLFVPDYSIAMRLESAGFIMQIRYHLFESDGVTTVRQWVSYSYKRWHGLVARITNHKIQRRIEQDLKRLKTMVEGSSKSHAA